MVGGRLARASVIKTAALLGVSKARGSKDMSAYTNHRKTTSAKRNRGRKSTLTERDHRTLRRIVSKNIAPQMNIHLEDSVNIKTALRVVVYEDVDGINLKQIYCSSGLL
jgi:hypothetical protein